MAESAPVSHPGIQRRRSSRVVQVVPITVAGVDALGRAFQERTSTHSINCHGARFHSKHYVLKNTWMVVEVPAQKGELEPTRVRAKVMWVQRPRTVRDLFQVSVELEAAGNVWGIAFPPEDWFEASMILATGLEPPTEIRPLEMAGEESRLDLIVPPEPMEEVWKVSRLGPVEMPAPAASMSQMDRMLGEAQEHVQEAVREATERSVAEASARLFADLNAQLGGAARRAVEGAATEEAQAAARRAMVEIEQAREAAVVMLREEWGEEFERIAEEARRELREQLDEAVRAGKESLAAELSAERAAFQQAAQTAKKATVPGPALDAAAASRLQMFEQQIAQAAEEARRVWMDRIQGQAEQARLHLAELEKATRTLDQDIAATTADLQTGWRQRLSAEMSAAEHLWNSHLELSIASAAQKAADRLRADTELSREEAQSRVAERMAEARTQLEEVATEAERAAEGLRGKLGQETFWAKAALAELEQAAARLEGQSARMETVSRRAMEEFEKRLKEEGERQQADFEEKFEESVKKLPARLKPALEAAAPPILERLAREMETRLSEHLADARSVLEQLGGMRGAAETALREHQQRLRQASEDASRDATGVLQEVAGRLGKDAEQAYRASLERAKEELDSQATDIRHTTFEALYNSSEWYQKKSLSQIQASLEKALEQAAAGLREKAAESSRVFSAEIERCTRSYIEHAQGILSEGAGELVEKTQGQLAQVAETASGVLTEEARRIHTQAMEELGAAAKEATTTSKMQVEGVAKQAAARIAAQAAISTTEFEAQIVERTDEALAEARGEFTDKLAALSAEWIARREAQEKLALERMEKLADNAADELQMANSDARIQLEQLRAETASEIRREREEGAGELRAMRAAAVERVEGVARGASEEMKCAGEEAATRIGALARESAAELTGMREESVRRIEGLGQEAYARIEGLARATAEEIGRLGEDALGRVAHVGSDTLGQMEAMKRAAVGEMSGVREESLRVMRTTAEDAGQKIEKLRDEATGEVAQAADQSVEQYRQRLENVANSWLLTAVTTLDQQSKQVLESVAEAAEERMRKTVAAMFGQMAETMRAKLLGVAEEIEPKTKAAGSS